MATELLGNTQTATYTYMTAPPLNGIGTPSFLPSIGSRSASVSAKPYDSYPAPAPLRRSLTCMPWRSSYFGVARRDPDVAHMCSMPEPRSDCSRVEINSFKVSPYFRSGLCDRGLTTGRTMHPADGPVAVRKAPLHFGALVAVW